MKTTKLTLCFIVENDQILLGYKKRGFGEGLWNGFGGKIESGESIIAAVVRELKEESGIEVKTVTHQGVLHFTFDESPDEILEVHVYRGEGVIGEPVESDEMRPEWFRINDIPYDSMWPDDIFWLPKFLEDKEFEGTFNFDRDRKITEHSLIVKGED